MSRSVSILLSLIVASICTKSPAQLWGGHDRGRREPIGGPLELVRFSDLHLVGLRP